MRTEELISTFPEGHGINLEIDAWTRSIILDINHPAETQRYRLHFENCVEWSFLFSELYAHLEEDAELYDLENAGILEFLSLPQLRRFRIVFKDDTELTIACRKFWMESIDGYDDTTIISKGNYS